jgi:hydroxymethylbilane synthase
VARLTIGTRGSALALWQANHVARVLCERHAGLEVEQRILETEGDAMQHGPVAAPIASAVGIFVRRIEQALLAGEVDLAVHSLKDMPTEQPDGLAVVAVPERHDPRDALISREGWELDRVPAGTRVGTGSFRRRCQLLHRRPDLDVVPIRGNVDTRLDKLARDEVGAIVLALAGLERLELDRFPMRPLDPDVCLPAVGQGALGLEIRQDDGETARFVSALNHAPSMACAEAERAFLRRLGGGCMAPASAYARITGGRVHLEAVVGSPDGRALLGERESGAIEDGAAIGARLAQRLLVAGAGRILADAREDEPRRG